MTLQSTVAPSKPLVRKFSAEGTAVFAFAVNSSDRAIRHSETEARIDFRHWRTRSN
jgi:hypothetical protein